ncbi:MAG: hypothetical protein QG616_541 [Pseudomonadota bacterium]|nr:hypothetical protein [Pseudomonadota bacterium]MDQ5945407.1 hypothetical protein [Pseudomonadota bacterium]
MPHRLDRTRTSICDTAARLIAEEGVSDYSQAKRKALRQLGLPDNTPMPSNAEVESALREWQSVFQDEEQIERVRHLRQKAAELMSILQDFRPYLTGSVLEGTAGRYAEIDLQLFADSAKEVEIFLLNRNIPYSHATPRNDRAEAVLVVETDDATTNLVIYPPLDERITPKGRDGRPRERARLPAVQLLLNANSA